jgi:dTDP-4-amino-4,6-dideoxygalactose transaminase
MSFDSITVFEKTIADYFNAPFAVATDSCTHAIELCLRLKKISRTSCPNRTYLSIPMTFSKLNLEWDWDYVKWENYYQLGNTNIIDAAVLWKKNSYISGTMMCLSFQFKKHLNLGRGGMILLDNLEDRNKLIEMSYDGRVRDIPWATQSVQTIGYHYYMTPETAQLGIDKLEEAKTRNPKIWNYNDYPNLENLPVFN